MIKRIATFLAVFALGLTMHVNAKSELVIAQGLDISGFDVHDYRTASVESVMINMFDYLIMRNADGNFVPSLAIDWGTISDETWYFKLREDALWHDGSAVTSKDVKFSLDRIASDPSLQSHQLFAHISSVEIIDEYEVHVTTEGPDPILLNRLSNSGGAIVPSGYIQEVGWDGFNRNPIGSGPYKFVEWIRDDRLILEANEDYFLGAPSYDRLVHRVIVEDTTRVNELITGGVDIAVNIPPHEQDRINAISGVSVLPQPTARVMLLVVNTADDKATGSQLVRDALNLAIDNQLLIDTVMSGFGVPVTGRVAQGITHSPLEYYDTYEYDPERAIELLDEAGYQPGELTITIQGPAGRYPMDADLAEIIGVMFEAVGINVRLEVLEWSAYSSRIWEVDNIENVALMGLSNTMFDAWYPQRAILCDGSYRNKTNWCNQDFDSAVNAAAVELDPEKRGKYLQEAYAIVAEEKPQIMLFASEDLVGVRDGVEWTPRIDGLLWMFEAHER